MTRFKSYSTLGCTFFLMLLVLLLVTSSTTSAQVIPGRSSVYLTVNSGDYTISFSTTEEDAKDVLLGYTQNFNDIAALPNGTTTLNSFTTLVKGVSYFKSSAVSFNATTYIVLFNYNTTSCSYYYFHSYLVWGQKLSSSPVFVTLPDGITKAYSSGPYSYVSPSDLIVTSSASSPISFDYFDFTHDDNLALTTTPDSKYFTTKVVNSFGTIRIRMEYFERLHYFSNFIFLNCRNATGCPVTLSVDANIGDDSTPIIVGATIGSIAFILVALVIVVIVSVIIVKRRVGKKAYSSINGF